MLQEKCQLDFILLQTFCFPSTFKGIYLWIMDDRSLVDRYWMIFSKDCKLRNILLNFVQLLWYIVLEYVNYWNWANIWTLKNSTKNVLIISKDLIFFFKWHTFCKSICKNVKNLCDHNYLFYFIKSTKLIPIT